MLDLLSYQAQSRLRSRVHGQDLHNRPQVSAAQHNSLDHVDSESLTDFDACAHPTPKGPSPTCGQLGKFSCNGSQAEKAIVSLLRFAKDINPDRARHL